MATSSRQLLKHISARVRHERQSRKWSQQLLADRAQVSRRMLAAIENEESNVSLATLDRIAAALDLRFAELLSEPSNAAAAAPLVAWKGKHKQSRALLLQSVPAVRTVELWEWSLACGERYRAEPDRRGMHELIYVIAGVLTLDIDGKRQHLAAGQSAMFPSDRAYVYLNEGKTLLRFLKNVVD
jgi:transcriptional regulator with XRE-family HTH domain